MSWLAIDAGHGGEDTGACSNGVVESQLVHAFSIDLKYRLERMRMQHGPLLIRPRNSQSMTFTQRNRVANQNGAKLVLSIHANSAADITQHGMLAFSYPGNAHGWRIGNAIIAAYPHRLKSARDKTIETSPEGWTKRAHRVVSAYSATCVLVELDYLTNQNDVMALEKREVYEHALIACQAGVLTAMDLLGIDW